MKSAERVLFLETGMKFFCYIKKTLGFSSKKIIKAVEIKHFSGFYDLLAFEGFLLKSATVPFYLYN